jgi:hypothetical protein
MADSIGSTGLEQAERLLRDLKSGHERFLSGCSAHPHASYERLEQLVDGQHPTAAILSCARFVPVELLFDAGFGDLYVVRNAGNACTNATIGSLEYGVGGLNISLLVVMGHEGCGAVTAAYSSHDALTPSCTIAHAISPLWTRQSGPRHPPGRPAAGVSPGVQAARHLVQGGGLLRSDSRQASCCWRPRITPCIAERSNGWARSMPAVRFSLPACWDKRGGLVARGGIC